MKKILCDSERIVMGGIPNFRFVYKSIRETKFSDITKAEYPEIAGTIQETSVIK